MSYTREALPSLNTPALPRLTNSDALRLNMFILFAQPKVLSQLAKHITESEKSTKEANKKSQMHLQQSHKKTNAHPESKAPARIQQPRSR